MRNSLGISVGAAGVCAALVTTDDTGHESIEYRTISADPGIHTDLGDLALSAIGLMTTQVPDRRIEPDAIAVAYRTESQAAAVRSAARKQRRAIRLVPETAATLAYLRSTGLVARYDRIALADLGASGLTVTVVAPADGTISARARTSEIGGDPTDGGSADRIASRIAEFVTEVAAHSLRVPAAVVLVGGGGNIAGLTPALDTAVDGVAIVVDEPEAATAKGAALLAASTERQEFPVVAGSGSRASAAVLGAFVMGALLLGYGVTEMMPQSEENYSPTGSLVETPEPTTAAPDRPAVDPDETRIPTGDPAPTSTWPRPAYPAPTWSAADPTDTTVPTSTTTPPATTTVPTTTAPATPEPTTPEPTTTPPAVPPTTQRPLPWIPPKWPELPGWLPDLVPDRVPPVGVQPPPDAGLAPSDPPTEPPLSRPPHLSGGTLDPGETVSPESGSPTPEVPDSSPR